MYSEVVSLMGLLQLWWSIHWESEYFAHKCVLECGVRMVMQLYWVLSGTALCNGNFISISCWFTVQTIVLRLSCYLYFQAWTRSGVRSVSSSMLCCTIFSRVLCADNSRAIWFVQLYIFGSCRTEWVSPKSQDACHLSFFFLVLLLRLLALPYRCVGLWVRCSHFFFLPVPTNKVTLPTCLPWSLFLWLCFAYFIFWC